MKYQSKWLALSIIFLASCQNANNEKEVINPQVAESSKGAVAAAHPLATQAGISILEQGGNAVDAAVATGFAIAVVEQSMNGLGGRFQAIIRKSDGSVTGIDATTQVPLSYDAATATQSRNGYPTIGVPGVVKGLTTLLEKHGTMDLATVMAPAISYAENGYELLPMAAMRHANAIDFIRQFEGTSSYFLNEDTTYLAGELFVQKDLANTLRIIAEKGGDAFYKGEIAEKMAEDVQANGGYLDMESLEKYEARESKIVTGNYRGYDLSSLWMPAFGAITIEMLHIMENLPMSDNSEAEWGNGFFVANTLAYQDRTKQTSDDMAELLTSKGYAKAKLDSMNGLEDQSTAMAFSQDWLTKDGHTTHYSTADKDGNMLAITQTVGPNMGSKVATPGLGFLYATTMGGYLGDLEGGQRVPSHISPTLVTKDGEPFLILGAAGGSRIPTAIVSTISRMIDRKMDLPTAMAAGRVFSIDTAVLVEMHEGTTWSQSDLDEMKSMGLNVVEVERPGSFGRVHAVYYDSEKKTWIGSADPDWEGTSEGVEEE
ncbi:MAG: gamma-glutamyltransferase [Cyclobacteriaceae bacterium]